MWGEKGLFDLHFHVSPSLRALTQAETEAEPVKECCYWHAPHGLLNLLSSTTGTTCLGVATFKVSWVLPHQLSVKETQHGFAHNQSGGGVFSVEVPLLG